MKRLIAFGLFALLALAIAACGTKPAAQPTPQPPAAEQGNGAQPQPEPQPKQNKAKITVYYSDNNLTELRQEEQEITYADDLEKYKKAIELLAKPQKKEHAPLWENFRYHSVTFENGQLTIDASGENQYNLGSGGELLAIDALKQTLFQFPEVEKIVILEDGKAVDSLMGHVDISEPLTRKE
jgi:predicted small lipoprotein YifL